MDQPVLLQRIGTLRLEPNPALVEHAHQRAESVQNRIADQITAFAGSMRFVYIYLGRMLDRVRRQELPLWPFDNDRLAGGDLSLHLRVD